LIAALVEQWIGFGLVAFFCGFVIADLCRPRTRAKGRSRVRSGQVRGKQAAADASGEDVTPRGERGD